MSSAEVKERLEPEDIGTGDLLAASHLHRYELAAELCAGRRVLDLCCGTGYGAQVLARTARAVNGVDVAQDAVARARALAGPGGPTFEQGDALAYLRGLGAEAYEAVVCFEGIEHVPDPDAVIAELARLAQAGVRVLLSLPNSRGLGEDNAFHVTEYGYEEMRTAIATLSAPVVLEQHLADASVILRTAADGEELRGRLAVEDERGAEWASHWLVLVGVAEEELALGTAKLALAATPQSTAYLRQLERANAELWQTNVRLARTWLGVHDAAAAALLHRLEDRNQRLSDELERWRAAAEENFRAKTGLEARLAAPRYRAVDALRDRVRRVPGLGQALRVLRGQ